MSITEEHFEYLVRKKGLAPETMARYGLTSESGYIAIPIGGAVKAYVPPTDSDPKKMWWPVSPEEGMTPPFPSFEKIRGCALLVEGEMDAMLASQELGIEVGSTTLGARKWSDEWSDTISSGQSEVTILYDNDEPGEQGSRIAAASLRKYGVRVKIAQWPKDRPRGWDVGEHFLNGGTAAELRAIIEGAVEMLPPGLALRADQFLSEERGQAGHLVEGIWPALCVGFVAGEPKTFKSFAATELAFAVASGKDFLGRHQVLQQGRTLIVQQESSWPAFQGRIRAAAKRYGMPEDLFILSNHGFNIQDEASSQKLEAEVARLRPSLVVLDPLASFIASGENSSDEMGQVVRLLRKIRDTYGTSVCVVHHSNKSSGQDRGGMKMRGSSALYGATEASLYLNRTEDADANVSWVKTELKESEGAPPFQIHLEPSTCLLNVVSPAVALKNTVKATNDDRRAYWQQSDLEMVDEGIPY